MIDVAPGTIVVDADIGCPLAAAALAAALDGDLLVRAARLAA